MIIIIKYFYDLNMHILSHQIYFTCVKKRNVLICIQSIFLKSSLFYKNTRDYEFLNLELNQTFEFTRIGTELNLLFKQTKM